MSASFAESGRPPWAVIAWTDYTNVYIELPSKEGPPYIQSFALSEAGLSKALHLMRDLHKRDLPRYGTHKVVQPVIQRKGAAQGSEASRDKVRELLKRKGII